MILDAWAVGFALMLAFLFGRLYERGKALRHLERANAHRREAVTRVGEASLAGLQRVSARLDAN